MSNLHRIRWFDGQVREGSYPNSSMLAQRFEISKRQAQRDIEYLAYSLSAPLLYVAKYRGYCYEDKTYALPLLYMTDEEKKILNYLARRYRQYDYDGATAAKRIADLLDRFTPEAPEAPELRLPVFDMNPRMMDHMERLNAAAAGHAVVTMTYKEGPEAETHAIWPLKLVSRHNCDYVDAYSATRQRQRLFRLDCIVSLTATSARFDPAGLEALEWSGGSGAGTAKKPFTAKLKLGAPADGSTWQGYRVRGFPEPLVAIVEFHDADAFLQQLWIAGDAWEALLAPKWLREKLERTCSGILERLHGTREE
ncbi:helix-turn-helix transcriptional regulator [Paenibacillus glycinis]|uniref:WYL domain-containing protein n=1 Tax=Paenibacillus glycinis TaxID=2697035 RepID=A0ABW9XN44_9BACL|nr:WYL domain-containing protein [Paenibacillus glycinis]NBD24060.1 WYL domain-containing protein [Paenibacillus glycinis]